MTSVVHVRKAPFTIYIGRKYQEFSESKWHNPSSHLAEGYDRHLALYDYYQRLLKSSELLAAIPELKDQILGCWCKPGRDCHGDILAALADNRTLPDYLIDWEWFRKKYYGGIVNG